MTAYFDTLDERPTTVVELLALWKKRFQTNLPGCPCRWGYWQLENCIKELERLHEGNLYEVEEK